MTLLAHISDLHLVEEGYRARDEASRRRLELLTLTRKKDPKARRLRAVDALRAAWRTGADHLLVTGDLTEDGVDSQFAVVAEVLGASDWPAHRVTLVPGNHDAYADARAFERALDGGPLARFAGTSRPGALTVLDGAVVVAASTAVHQTYPRAVGELDAASVGAIERGAQLAARAGRVAVVAMHHAPVAHTFAPKRWIDGLIDDAAISWLLGRHDGLAVVHGHTHRATSSPVRAGGPARVFAAPAVVDGGATVRLYEARLGVISACSDIFERPRSAAPWSFAAA